MIQLHGTPLSHFTRKVRIVLAELGVAYEQVWSPSVMRTAAAAYGDNPLLRIPTLVDGPATIFDSDHIARYLVDRFDRADWLGIATTDPGELNRLAVANGIMANEVVLILAKRGGGIADLDAVGYFRKLTQAIADGLAWLDAHVVPDGPFDYRDVTAICLWDHLAHYGLVALDPYHRLAARVARFADRPSVARTTPAASLARATAEGWTAP